MIANGKTDLGPVLPYYTTFFYFNSLCNFSSLEIENIQVALQMLSAAYRQKDQALVRQCIEILDSKLDPKNVLEIYASLGKLKKHTSNNFAPSAPPVENDSQRDWAQELTDSLEHNCLLEIDKHADYVLQHGDVLELPYSDLLKILTRDTLQVSSEMLVYITVLKWANRECQRRGIQPNPTKIRDVVEDLRYSPRYGRMTADEFSCRKINGEKGPKKSKILEEYEWRRIQFYIKEKDKKRPVEELSYKMSQKRVLGDEKPKILSSQSSVRAKNTANNSNTQCSTTNSTCDKFLLNFLTCWSAVFD